VPAEAINDQYYRRLKDKLGTTAVPTGEVEFDGTRAYLVGEEQRDNGYVEEFVTSRLLLEEAQAGFEDDNGRVALVARRFVDRELRESESRGITDGDRFAVEFFEPIVYFASVSASEVVVSMHC